MNLLRAASLVSLLTLASRITGLARELLIAAFFGASAWTDAFNVAFRIPNLFRRLFAEGAFTQAFVPILAESKAQQGELATHQLLNAVATVLFSALMLTAFLGVVGAPVLVYMMASGLQQSPEGFQAAVVLTRWMFPYIVFMSLVALAAGVLNTWKRFVIPAATPVLLNVAMIAAAWGLAPRLAAWGWPPIYALAVGVMLGGLLQLAAQLWALHQLALFPRLGLTPHAFKQAWQHPGCKRILKQMAPALLGVSVAQLSLLINTQIASHLVTGSVSWLSYADRLMEFPTALLGVALGVVLLPQLSLAQAEKNWQGYSDLLDWGLRLMLLLALPCAVALLIFAKPLVSSLYHYGAFTARDVEQTAWALSAYGVGLLGLIGVKVLAPGFYAQQNIRTPVRIAVCVLILTQVMNVFFVPWFAHAGLALSIACGALLNAAWLLWGLRTSQAYRPLPGWGLFFVRVLGACALMASLLWWATLRMDWVAMHATPFLRLLWLFALVLAAAALYAGVLTLSGLRWRELVRKA